MAESITNKGSEAPTKGNAARIPTEERYEQNAKNVPNSVKNAKREEFDFKRDYSPHATNERLNWGVKERDTWLEKEHWTDSALGRAAIEFVARITLGGMFYAWMGNSEALKAVDKYDPAVYDKMENKSWLVKVAHFVDSTIGAGMSKGFSAYYQGARDDKDRSKADMALRFRKTRPDHSLDNQGILPGRSLGAEYVKVTGDFAAMTMGAGIGRELLLNTLNPRERKAWLNEKGEFELGHAAKRFGSKVWELITYNVGEDIVASLPYVFFLRGTRNIIDKGAKGFGFGSDMAVDAGGSLVITDKGQIQSELQHAGAIDLQARFTGYNVLTQMYRDGYNAVADSLTSWQKNNFAIKLPDPASIPQAIVDRTKGGARYMAISAIRSIIQMTPSVPFFSIIRTPASKLDGFAVHNKLGIVEAKIDRADERGLAWHRLRRKDKDFDTTTEIRWSEKHETACIPGTEGAYFQKNPFYDDDGVTRYTPFNASAEGMGLNYSFTSSVTDKIGSTVHEIAKAPIWYKAQKWFWDAVSQKGDDGKKHAESAALAGMPYATYFAAKVYFREQYVNEQMNTAIGRMLDGVLKWNKHEFKEGMSEITRTMMRLPMRETSRKAELILNHREHPTDKSPIPERWSPELHKEYLKKTELGIEPDPYELMEQLSKQRADFYADRSAVYHEAQKKKEATVKSKPAKEEILSRIKAENWKENTQAAAAIEQQQMAGM